MTIKNLVYYGCCPKCGSERVTEKEAVCGTTWRNPGDVTQTLACAYIKRLKQEHAKFKEDAEDVQCGLVAQANGKAKFILDDARAKAEVMLDTIKQELREEFKQKIADALGIQTEDSGW